MKWPRNSFGATLASQPKRIIASAISAYLRHGDAGFTASFGASTFFAAAAAERRPESAARPGDFTFANNGHAAHYHVIEIDNDIAVFLFAQQLQQVHQVGAVELGGLGRQTARKIGVTDDFHAVGGGHHFARYGVLTVPPFCEARSTTTLPDFMESTISRVISFGAVCPGLTPW